MSGLSLTGALPLGWILLGAGLCFLFAFWTYRHTNPPVPTALRRFLALLRAGSLLLIWLFAVNLTWHWSRLETAKPHLAIMVDESSSMSETDGVGNRWETLKNIIDDKGFGQLEDHFALEWYRFSETLEKVNDSQVKGPPEGGTTNLQRALELLPGISASRQDALLLLTDGGFNAGGSYLAAAEELGVPIYTVGIGDSLPQRDVRIQSVSAPSSSYLGDSLGLEVAVHANSMEGQLSVIVEDEAGNQLASRQLSLHDGVSERELLIPVYPSHDGMQRFNVRIEPRGGEVNFENNARSVAVDVRSRRRTVLLLAGHPSADAATLARTLEDDPDSEVTVVIGRGGSAEAVRGEWSSATGEFDVICLLLESPWSAEGINAVRTALDETTTLLLITGAREPSTELLNQLQQRTGSWRIVPSLDGAELVSETPHPLLTRDGTLLRGGEPPLPLGRVEFLRAERLMIGKTPDVMRPALQIRNAPGRAILFSGGGLTDLALFAGSGSEGSREFEAMLARWMLWLADDEAGKPLTIAPESEVVSRGATAQLNINAFSAVGRPPASGELAISVSGPDGTSRQLAAVAQRSGEYSVRFVPWAEGRYRVVVVAEVDGEAASAQTTLFADPFSLEKADTRMKPEPLRQLALATGGQYLNSDDLDRLGELLPSKPTVREVSGSWRPVGRWFTLLTAVLLLALEWAIRLRRGMM